MKKEGIVFNTLLVAMGEVGIKLLGLIRDIVIAGLFGASAQLDAFFVALNVPNIFITVLGSALTTAFIPVYFRYREKAGADEHKRFLANLSTCVVILFFILSIAVFILAGPLIKIMAPSFPAQQAILATTLVRYLSVLTFITGLVVYLKAPAQCENKFSWAVASDLTNNGMVLLAVIMLVPVLGLNGLVCAFIGGAICQAAILFFRYFKDHGRLTTRINLSDKGLREVFYLSLPLYIGMLTSNISIIVDKAMASGLVAGSISALTYADKIRNLPITIFGTAMVTVLFPALSRMVTMKKENEISLLLERVSKVSLLAGFYMVNMLWLLAVPVTALLFERGNFARGATIMTAEALQFFSLGIPAVVLGTVLLRVYHAYQDTKTPVILGLISVTVNIVLNFLLIGSMAHRGIALATASANWVWFFLLAFYLHRFSGERIFSGWTKLFFFIIKTAVTNLAVYGLGKKLLHVISGRLPETLLMFVALVICTLCFMALALLLGLAKDLGIRIFKRETDHSNQPNN